jgi:diaminohydroxyphosphoribosylaminopyrimidine deaminase/5-amino-6-(5-phosphoribosylamino)uracil reductase
MSLDGKIATYTGESRWITGAESRAHAMQLRAGADATLVGVNTVLADDPALTVRLTEGGRLKAPVRSPRRIILDSQARTPLHAKLLNDESARLTTIIVTKGAPAKRVQALRRKVRVEIAPLNAGTIDLRWLMRMLGKHDVTSLLVEGGGEVNASFLFRGLAHRIAFFYAPKIIGGREARKGVAGKAIVNMNDALKLDQIEYRWLGEDLFMTGLLRGQAQS